MSERKPLPPGAELGQPPTPQGITLSDRVFYLALLVIGASYVLLILSMLVADAAYMGTQSWRVATASSQPLWSLLTANPVVAALADRKIQYSIWLSLIACTLSAVLSVFVAIPLGYLMSRYRFRGRQLVDAILDIPIVLPPLVVGLSLLILFQFPPFSWAARSIVYQVPAVILSQFAVASAFAVRTMKATFDHIDPRCEQVALSLGCSRLQAFGWVVVPEAGRGITTALTLAWARSLGEFGPLLIFAGATRLKTEVLSTSVFLEMNVGQLEAAVAVSLIMVVAAVIVLIIARLWGQRDMGL
jgi:molybdate transport system permease protein